MQASLSTLLGRGKPVVEGPAPINVSKAQPPITQEAESLRLELVRVMKINGAGLRSVAEYILQREATIRGTAQTREAELTARNAELETLLRAASACLEASRSVG